MKTNKDVFVENLNFYLNEKEMTPMDLARQLGYPETTVYNWTQKVAYPRLDKIQEIADFFGVYKSNLTEEKTTAERFSSLSKAIPLVGRIAAGTPVLAEQNIEDYFSIDKSIKCDFCLRVQGDSMIDEGVLSGDIVFIRKQSTVENGEIAAVVVDGEATLKRIFLKNGTIILQPANKNYEPIILTDGDVRIAGKLAAVLNVRN